MRNSNLVVGLMMLVAPLSLAGSASAQNARRGLAPPQPLHGSFEPGKTEWGDPDFRATWSVQPIYDAGIPLQRPETQGNRLWLTDVEFAARLEQAKKSDGAYRNEVEANGTIGLADWMRSTPFARRSSLIVSPDNGRLPPMTPRTEAVFNAGRNSWKDNQPIDWVTDFDSYDRCITRDLPAAILPWPNNDGIRVFQSPGLVAIQLEVLGTRIIPVDHGGRWPDEVRSWTGRSLAHWEGATLVIETTGIAAGDSASADVSKRAGSPITGRSGGLVPMSEKAETVERLALTGPNTLAYAVTYSDPDAYLAPWTAEVEWTRDDSYRLYEYACHEGNAIRELIAASRAQRKKDAEAAKGAGE